MEAEQERDINNLHDSQPSTPSTATCLFSSRSLNLAPFPQSVCLPRLHLMSSSHLSSETMQTVPKQPSDLKELPTPLGKEKQ